MNRRRRQLLGTSAAAVVGSLAAWASRAHGQAVSPPRRMPVIFVGHGSPMNVLADNMFTRQLGIWGRSLPHPTAILSVSAHWLTPGLSAVGVQAQPETIHDFGGFPQALYQVRYAAPGAPGVAREAAALVHRTAVRASPEWGLDHGTWTVLHHLFPKADVPVFQLSIDYDKPGLFHHAIGRDLAALRDRGVLIMGSGNIVHNLRATESRVLESRTATQPWAQAFDAAVARALDAHDYKALANYAQLDASSTMAVPTPDHYWPLLYALGAAGGDNLHTVFAAFHAGTISMRCLQFGA